MSQAAFTRNFLFFLESAADAAFSIHSALLAHFYTLLLSSRILRCSRNSYIRRPPCSSSRSYARR